MAGLDGKECGSCGEWQPYTEYYQVPSRGSKDGYGSYCKECKRQHQRDYNAKVRNDVLDAYGGLCACCGESRRVFLSIDHVNEDGAAHRKEIGSAYRGGLKIYIWLRRHDYPEGFQVLCRNCNWAKSNGGCPHREAA